MTEPKKHRLTKQRKVILEEIQKLCTHPTAEEIFEIVKKKIPSINFSTVYRNLEFLESQKLIIRLQTKGRKARYDGNTEHHLHLVCTFCEKVIDLFDEAEIGVKSEILEKSGFKPCLHYLEIPGTCRDCQKEL